MLAEYWSDGHQTGAREARMGGEDVLLVWGTNNEFRGASLAILDLGQVHGHAPAVKESTCAATAARGAARAPGVPALVHVGTRGGLCHGA